MLHTVNHLHSCPTLSHVKCLSHTVTHVAYGPWQGAWRSILEAIKGQQVADQEQLLCQAAYFTLALVKLRNYNAANAEVAKLGDLKAARFTKPGQDGRQNKPHTP